MSSGEDTTDLKRKLGQLQVEVLLESLLIHTISSKDTGLSVCACVSLRPLGWVCSDPPLLEVGVEERQQRLWRQAQCQEGGAGGEAEMPRHEGQET